MENLELWVGVEPTVSRVGDETLDQLALSGFDRRLEDIDRLASVGARAVRFPLLWERTAPDGPEHADWRWADERLARLAGHGVTPIVGLVHHGSGPRGTHLLDPAFAEGVRAYARAVAERYPHVDAYTPVNEPLTTARFSALYGHWYPHARDERSLWRALLHQMRATVLAMGEIRKVNPAARLIQTEDLGFVHSTPALRDQAGFENERRWLSLDLLMGRVDEHHPLWDHLRRVMGATEAELRPFAEHPCPPDLVGLNVYVTSERFLDERLHRYPPHTHGGNGRARYADVEAVRVLGEGIGGPGARLREAHDRYGLPLAITEVHLGCTREEQLRWLHETWQAAQDARREGADVRAVTAWAALGAFEWNSLLTRRSGHYESGLWDVRAPEPRPTALLGLARDLAAGRPPAHPVLGGPGWWHRAERLTFPPHGPVHADPPAGRPLLITGATGMFGQALARACEGRGLPHLSLSCRDLDPADSASVERTLKDHHPWAVVDAAGVVRMDAAEHDPRIPHENVPGPQVLARACAKEDVRLLTFSSDLVFGAREGVRLPFLESDAPGPLNASGRARLAAEEGVLARLPGALVVRTGALFGPWDPQNFAAHVRRELQAGRRVRAARDRVVSLTFVPDLAHAVLDLLIDGETGIWHLAHAAAVTWADFARQVARVSGLDPDGVEGVDAATLPLPASLPSALASERGWPLPSLSSALERWSAQVENLERELTAAD
ncbi:family 1 glycosylhydrolase [Deinococcus sp. YIM 134068]|uniref:family 1 glycosylhydrolase n=1 Tax=Deinococcus lichenicola TaxID=3118910 RepID=UPI002F92B02C